MTFNSALSGLNAAANDLRVTGQNIANASTIGFKRSRAEFGDVYASTLLGSGTNLIGSGVKLANVAQQFEQGTITFTNNSLDLAIDGNGFFILAQGGSRIYSRAGQFGIDKDGFVVNNSQAKVQGFSVSDTGQVGGVLGDLRVSNENPLPRVTRSKRVQAAHRVRCSIPNALWSSHVVAQVWTTWWRRAMCRAQRPV